MESNRMQTLCVHGGRAPEESDPALAPSIQLSSTFVQFPSTHALTDAGNWDEPLVYSRYKNPTCADVEMRLAALEGAQRAVVFGSGTAAMHAGILALAEPGKPIALPRQLYGGTLDLARSELERLGFAPLDFDLGDPASLATVLDEGASLVVCESLSNPVLSVADLPSIADAAHARGARLLVDATFATPVLQRPLELGADLVMHSATKYFGGHSDLTAGVLCGGAEVGERAWQLRKRLGAILDAHSAFLLDRGLKTLVLRMREQCKNALHLAHVLDATPGVVRVHYPGLESHPDHALAARLLNGGAGGVLSFEIEGGDEALRPYVGRLRLAFDAPSFGGVETLVSLPAFMSHVGLSPEERLRAGIRPGLVRVAVGIEDPADLADDFASALGGGATIMSRPS
ncbi:MAG: aminotransferase class I/II-fold pyridoxal phosphate-dependent enzyme [bacterium]|nr:aminotransferase class I/II-fold pyridoxal phosphate-dependent enzyme [bacterium]